MKKILFIVDAQNDFMPGGALAVADGDKIIPTINEYLKDENVMEICFSRDWHPENHTSFAKNHNVEPFTIVKEEMKWPIHCVANTFGAEINKNIIIPLNKTITSKLNYIAKGMDKDKEEYSALNNPIVAERFKITVEGVLAENNFKLTEVIFCGLATDYCIKSTVLDAVKILKNIKSNINIIVDLKGCRGVAKETTENAIKEMKNAGIGIKE